MRSKTAAYRLSAGFGLQRISWPAARDSQYNRGTCLVSRLLETTNALLLTPLADKERSMDFARGYDYHRDETSGMWRLTSPSGHLLYESRWHVHVARVCQRLNARFAAPQLAIDARRFNPPPVLQAALLA
jgi:hypothetical protein